jgi:hypothetical protein
MTTGGQNMKTLQEDQTTLLTSFLIECYESILTCVENSRVDRLIVNDGGVEILHDDATTGWTDHLSFRFCFGKPQWLDLIGNVCEDPRAYRVFIPSPPGPPLGFMYERFLSEQDDATAIDEFRSFFSDWLIGTICLRVELAGGFGFRWTLLNGSLLLAERRWWLYPWWMRRSICEYRCALEQISP